MADLLEEQAELDGFLFGEFTPIQLLQNGFNPGNIDTRTQDVSRAQDDGEDFGRDYLSGPELQFTFGIEHGFDMWPTYWAMAAAWRADTVRDTPGAVSTLRYRRAGQNYRLLGRGRKFDIAAGDVKDDTFQIVTATFKLAAPEWYLEPDNGTSRSLTLPLIAPTSNGGVSPPYTAPWRTVASTQPRVGEVTVGGARAAPFRVRVYGPSAGGSLRGFTIAGDGWQFTSSAVLAYDQSAVIDTRVGTFTRSGVSLEGTLARGARMRSRLAVGHQFIQFSGGDPSGSARAVVSWNDTVPA